MNDVDVIHLMVHWSVLNALVNVASRRAGKPYVICPAGALPIFGRLAWLKRCYNLIVGRSIIRKASAHTAVTATEFLQFATYSLLRDPKIVISNGVRKEDFVDFDKTLLVSRGVKEAPTILFMGRLNPIRGMICCYRPFCMYGTFIRIISSYGYDSY